MFSFNFAVGCTKYCQQAEYCLNFHSFNHGYFNNCLSDTLLLWELVLVIYLNKVPLFGIMAPV